MQHDDLTIGEAVVHDQVKRGAVVHDRVTGGAVVHDQVMEGAVQHDDLTIGAAVVHDQVTNDQNLRGPVLQQSVSNIPSPVPTSRVPAHKTQLYIFMSRMGPIEGDRGAKRFSFNAEIKSLIQRLHGKLCQINLKLRELQLHTFYISRNIKQLHYDIHEHWVGKLKKSPSEWDSSDSYLSEEYSPDSSLREGDSPDN